MLPLHPLLLLLLLLCSLASAAAGGGGGGGLLEADAAALEDLRGSLRDLRGSEYFASWSSPDPCSYAGVSCAADGGGAGALRVSALALGTGLADSPGLAGELPDSLANLTALTELVLYPGRVTGAIPPGIGRGLRRLRLLALSGNELTGPIPDSLAELPELHTLDLGNNRLQGVIPCGLLLKLRVLVLANNGGLSGELPAEFAESGILHIDLSGNSVAGELPPLPRSIRYLSVSANAMRGSLDAAFSGELPDLKFLGLSMNCFSGTIPAAVFALPSADSLLLGHNNFTGPITVPAEAAAAPPPWAVVDVSHNGVSGEVPAALAAAASLYVNNNRMSGEVPEAVARSVVAGRMTTFYAQHNFLTGFRLPPRPQLPDSAALCLAYNCMELPPAAAAATGCPAIGGPLQARPADQCRYGSTAAEVHPGGGDG